MSQMTATKTIFDCIKQLKWADVRRNKFCVDQRTPHLNPLPLFFLSQFGSHMFRHALPSGEAQRVQSENQQSTLPQPFCPGLSIQQTNTFS